MYTPLVPATPKRAAPNARPKTPKFDPQVHGVDIETDLHGGNGVDTFLQLIKRSPKKQAIENKSLEAQPQLGPGGEEQVITVQLPTQTEAQSEGRSQTEETAVEPRVVCRPSNILWLLANILHQALGNTVSEVPTEQLKSLAINTHTPDTAAPLAVKKTRVTAATATATATNVTTAVASEDQQPELLKSTTSLPPRQRVPSQKAPTTPPRTERKQSSSKKTPSKNNMPTTPPRTSIAKYSSPRNTTAKATGKTQCERGMNPAPTTPSHSPRTKSIPLVQCASEKISPNTPPKASSKPTAVLSRQKSPKQAVPSGSLPNLQNKLLPHHGLATTSPPTSPQKEGVKQPRKNMVENPKGRPMTTKPSNSPPHALPRGKEPVIYPKAPVKETLTIRTKRAASGPLPPTKRPRPIPSTPGESTRNLQGSNTSSTIAMAARPRIASLNTKPLSPIKSSKPPTKPTMFKLLGQEVAKKQAEEKEARKKRMEAAEAAKALQKRKEAELRKQAPVRNASLSNKTLKGSSVCAAAMKQLEGGNAAASGGKAKVSSKQSKTKSTNGPTDASQPALLIQKREPTTKLTSTTSKPVMSRNASGPASSTPNGNTLLTPKQGDISQRENTRKEAAEKGRVAVLEWAAQQKNRRDQTNPQGQVT